MSEAPRPAADLFGGSQALPPDRVDAAEAVADDPAALIEALTRALGELSSDFERAR